MEQTRLNQAGGGRTLMRSKRQALEDGDQPLLGEVSPRDNEKPPTATTLRPESS